MRKETFLNKKQEKRGLCFTFCLNFMSMKYIVSGVIVGLLICHFLLNHMQTKSKTSSIKK